MKIHIETNDLHRPIRLSIPNSLIFNRLFSRIAFHYMKKEASSLYSQDIYNLFKEFNKSIHTFGHFEMVHIEDSDGTFISIVL